MVDEGDNEVGEREGGGDGDEDEEGENGPLSHREKLAVPRYLVS